MKNYRSKNRVSKTARWLALVFGILWIFTFISEAFVGKEKITGEGIMLTVLVALIISSIIIAIWFEKIGGILIATFSIALCVFAYSTAGRNKPFAVLVSGAPFLIVGILFLVSWKIEQDKQKNLN